MEREDLERQYESQFAGLNEVYKLAAGGLNVEYTKLLRDVKVLEQALECGAIQKWRWVSSIIDGLTDSKEVEAFTAAAKGGPLDGKHEAARQIVDCLAKWRREEVIKGDDSALKAFDVLEKHAHQGMCAVIAASR